ncbi:hypothetical protein [Elioraea sp.]|uniref:hypothetical protein n=1 Tax=Elioraea sp. TaxID=2185103 RepID=UPI0025BE9EA0|nr:hypothetical protein [Elioraea sp.]
MKEVIATIGGVRSAAIAAGVSEDQVAGYRDGKSKPALPAIVGLARAADVNLHWLATGEGPKESEQQLTRQLLPGSDILLVPRVALELASLSPPALRRTGEVVALSADAAREAQNLDVATLAVADARGLSLVLPGVELADIFIDTAQTEVRPEGSIFVFAQGAEVFVRWLQLDPDGLLVGEPGKTSAHRLLTVPVTVLGRVFRLAGSTSYA